MNMYKLRHVRYYSGPPLKRYNGLTNWPSIVWNTKIPATAKVFSGIIAGAISFTHIHPNTLVTLGPPLAVGTYFLWRRVNHRQYLRLVDLVKPQNALDWENDGCKVRIYNYDESDVRNVLKGIDNLHQHFQAQALLLVESRIIDYVVDKASDSNVSPLISLLLDENSQVGVHLGDVETLVTTKAETVGIDGETHITDFVRFSVGLYSSKSMKTRTRLGVANVSMLAEPQPKGDELDYHDYRMAIELIPYYVSGGKEVILETDGGIQSVEEYKKKDE